MRDAFDCSSARERRKRRFMETNTDARRRILPSVSTGRAVLQGAVVGGATHLFLTTPLWVADGDQRQLARDAEAHLPHGCAVLAVIRF